MKLKNAKKSRDTAPLMQRRHILLALVTMATQKNDIKFVEPCVSEILIQLHSHPHSNTYVA